MKYIYHLQIQKPDGEWFTSSYGDPRQYYFGWLAHRRESPGPGLGARIVRYPEALVRTGAMPVDGGDLVEYVPAIEDVSIGMVAGWPTWQQYARAGVKALERATQIAARDKQPALVGQILRTAVSAVSGILEAS